VVSMLIVRFERRPLVIGLPNEGDQEPNKLSAPRLFTRLRRTLVGAGVSRRDVNRGGPAVVDVSLELSCVKNRRLPLRWAFYLSSDKIALREKARSKRHVDGIQSVRQVAVLSFEGNETYCKRLSFEPNTVDSFRRR
jgi:hypothetical protein